MLLKDNQFNIVYFYFEVGHVSSINISFAFNMCQHCFKHLEYNLNKVEKSKP